MEADAQEISELSLYDACELACHQSVTCKNWKAFYQKEFIAQFVHFVMQGVGMRDPLFKEVFRDVTFTGSSCDGLKIGLPNEYDVSINLCLPMMPSLKVYSDPRPQHAGEVTIEYFGAALQSVLHSDKRDIYQKMESWGDAQGRLIPDKVRTWLQSLMQTYIAVKRPMLHKKYNVKFVYLKRSGATTTLQIKLENGFDIDIDFVAALVFENINPPEPFRPLPDSTVMTWSAVTKSKPRPRHKVKWNRAYGNVPPKPEEKVAAEDEDELPKFGYGGDKLGRRNRPKKVKNPGQPDEEQPEEEQLEGKKQHTEGVHWRLSFWAVENRLLQNRQSVKTAIKMIKRLRDVRKWRSLSSYVIKTVALHELNSHDWNSLRLDQVFMILLERLQFRMKSNRMRYYWDERCNLLKGTMKRTVREDIATRLSRDLKHFAANPIEVIKTLVVDTDVGSKKSEESEISCEALARSLPELFSAVSPPTISDEQLAEELYLLSLIS